MGRLIASLEGVEYAEEPPMLSALIPMINQLEQDTWQLLHDAYLFEEHIIPSLAGRRINLNSFDDSFVGRVKDQKEIDHRMSRSFRHAELYHVALTGVCSYKVPAALIYLEKMMLYMPSMSAIVMLRHPASVIRSFLGKEWYSDAHLNGVSGQCNAVPAHWLFRKDERRLNLPYWLEESEVDHFMNLNETGRACFSYVKQHEGLSASIGTSSIIVDYDKLLRNPEDTLTRIASKLDLNFGPMTSELLRGVIPQKNFQAVWEDVPRDLKSRAENIYEEWRSWSL